MCSTGGAPAWRNEAPLLHPISNAGCTIWESRLWLFTPNQVAQVYDFESETWSEQELGWKVHDHPRAIAVDRVLYVITVPPGDFFTP